MPKVSLGWTECQGMSGVAIASMRLDRVFFASRVLFEHRVFASIVDWQHNAMQEHGRRES